MDFTPQGLPYPGLGEENNPPRFIQELAQAMDAMLPRAGIWSGTAANGVTDRAVLFDTPFAVGVTPAVALGVRDSNIDWISAQTLSVSRTGFTLRVRNGNSSALQVAVDYIAVAP
jgi:hypothetical protein